MSSTGQGRKGLGSPIGHEQRRLIGLQQRLFADVRIGIVDEGTGLHVAVGVDVRVAAATGDAATHRIAIVPKVHGEQGLGFAELMNETEICPDHVHMLVSIPPKVSVSSFMGCLKGKSSLKIYE